MAFQPVSMTPDRTAGSVINRNNRQEEAQAMSDAGAAVVSFGTGAGVLGADRVMITGVGPDGKLEVSYEKKQSIFGWLAEGWNKLLGTNQANLPGVAQNNRAAGAEGTGLPKGKWNI